MKLTNKNNWPSILVDAISHNNYAGYVKDAFCSASALIQPDHYFALRTVLKDKGIEITEDVSDRLWAFFGSALHYVIENAAKNKDNVFSEELLTANIQGEKISGVCDYYDIDKNAIWDFKTTSVWTLIYDSRRKEWEEQLNIYAWLFCKNNIPVKDVKILVIARDWSNTDAIRRENYPQSPVAEITLKLWSIEEQEKFITEKINNKKNSIQELIAGKYSECSKDERWEKPSVWAIHKEGRKSAVKLHESELEAKEHLETLDKKHYIELRPGERTRCESYCSINNYCSSYKIYKGE